MEGWRHRMMRVEGLQIHVRPESGCNPPEPDWYWTVWVTDSQVKNPMKGRWSSVGTLEGSMGALVAAMQACLWVWRKEHGQKEGY